jgi:hypothetical protein
VKRPRFFRANGPMPAEATLRVERIPGFEHLTESEWAEKIRVAVQEEEDGARRRRAAANVRVMGRKAVLDTKPTHAPTTPAPRRMVRPHLACRNRERRAGELRKVRAFRIAHRNALLMWIAGRRDVIFPHGTYRMRMFGVRCAPNPGLELGMGRLDARPVAIGAATGPPPARCVPVDVDRVSLIRGASRPF